MITEKHNRQAATSNKADAATQPTSGAATIPVFELPYPTAVAVRALPDGLSPITCVLLLTSVVSIP